MRDGRLWVGEYVRMGKLQAVGMRSLRILPCAFSEPQMISTKTPTKKSSARPRPVTLSCLAAQMLGHSRVAKATLTARQLSTAFPAFNSQEVTYALAELVDKQLVTQKGMEDHA